MQAGYFEDTYGISAQNRGLRLLVFIETIIALLRFSVSSHKQKRARKGQSIFGAAHIATRDQYSQTF